MTRLEVAAWLLRAELELQAAKRGLNGTMKAAERYRAARADVVNAERVARALLGRGFV